ncbi:MAG: hypothetical protein LBF05_01500 [Tannerella sp.]|jgi:hypothetical protein|nr:hypothetical protein [Tannerella sp.]
MKKKHFFLFAAIWCVCCSSCKKEKLAIAGSGWQEIAIIDKASGNIEWKYQLEKEDECNDVEVTPEGHVLFAYSKGARLINRNHEIIWDYKAKDNEEIHTATRLKEGGYMLAVCGEPARIVELDENGKEAKEIPFRTIIFDTHKQFRQVAKTDDGLYLIPLIEKRKILQISPEGRNKGSVYVGYDLFSVKPLENKNMLVSCGRDGKLIEIDPAKQHADSTIVTNRIKGASLLYVGEIFLYKNGNKLIANSNMYSDDKSQPLLLEIDPDNEVIWSLPFNREIKNITTVYSFFE